MSRLFFFTMAVTGQVTLWDQQSLGHGPIAIVVYPTNPDTSAVTASPRLSAVATSQTAALLIPTQLGEFLHAHAEAILVCHGGAALHWLLHDYLTDAKDRAVLWRYSRESRLCDVQLLDQHIRRFEGTDRGPRSLAELAVHYTQVALPADPELKNRVVAAWPALLQGSHGDLLDLVGRVATTTLQLFQKLRAKADQIMTAVAKAHEPVPRSAPSPELQQQLAANADRIRQLYADQHRTRQLYADQQRAFGGPGETVELGPDRKTAESARRCYGPLGVSIDVQGAIAAHQLARQLKIAHERRRKINDAGERLYREASARLSCDHDGRGCFKWKGKLVDRDSAGLPINYPEKLHAWLSRLADGFVDWHGFPATVSIPRDENGSPCLDPERWGHWPECDLGLAAYRNLMRAAAMIRLSADTPWPAYEMVPLLRCSAPDATFVRGTVGPLIQPRDGHVFLVGTLAELRLRCFATVCRNSDYAGNGRLYGYFLNDADPINLIAAELYARATVNGHATDRRPAGKAGEESHDLHESLEGIVYAFRDPHGIPGSTRSEWLRRTHALLASLPLGLPPSLLRTFLNQKYAVELPENELQRLVDILTEQIGYELKGYRGLDIDAMVARYSGRSINTVLPALWEHDHPDTMQDALRNDLLERGPRNRQPRAVWGLLQHAGPLPADVADRILRHSAFTLAGRVTPWAYPAEVRRFECLYAADEVMKAVAYALVAADYRLVALAEDTFVLEMPMATVTEETQCQIQELVAGETVPLVGPVAPSCRLEQASEW